MPETFSNNATPKYLGYVYQVLVAIEQCFNAPKNTTIWIECFGDVSNERTSIEVKHHLKKKNLSNGSIDFWKTIKNLTVEDTSLFYSFVLHTTDNIPTDSMFYEWNDLNKTDKYKKLKNYSPSETIKPLYKIIIEDSDKKQLLSILNKLVIKSSQSSVGEKWEELKEHRSLSFIPEKFKDDAIHWIYGYVNKKAINDPNKWEISINDFDADMTRALNKYISDEIPFPIVKKTDVEYSEEGLLFVDKLNQIGLQKKSIENSVYDFLRSKNVEIKLLNYEPISMSENIEEFDGEILEELEDIKMGFLSKIQDIKDMSVSIALFHECNKLPSKKIRGVKDTQRFFRKGRAHHNVNNSNFDWVFSDDEL